MLRELFMVGAGGFAGSCARYLVNYFCVARVDGSLPVATLVVNLAGCFLIGLLSGVLERGFMLSPAQGLLLVTGFCGGFTTFSTFAAELWHMGTGGELVMALLYLAASIIAGVLLVGAGRWLTM